MKVLHISTPASWRGGEQQAAYLAVALKKEGVSQCILTPDGSELSQRLSDAGIPFSFFSSRGLFGFKLASQIQQLCKSEKFDLIHTHDSHAHSAAVISHAFFGNTVPLVVSRRVDFAVSSSPFSAWKYNHPAVKRIICVSDMIRQITAPAIRNKEVLRVVHSGIDLSRYSVIPAARILQQELGLPERTFLVGNLSALADHKDYPTFIKVAKLVTTQHPDIHFIIAGEGPEEKNIRNIISQEQLEQHVHLLGFRKDVPQVMKSLDVFLITSQTEGLGTIILEAFAAGVPVVATRAGGIPELVEDEQTGLSAEVGDAAKLAKDILRIFGDAALRQRLSERAAMKVQEFTFSTTAAKTKAIYEEVLQS